MKLLVHAQLHTSEYRGDHSADVIQVLNCPAGTRIEQLADALVENGALHKNDYIVIRATEIKEGETI